MVRFVWTYSRGSCDTGCFGKIPGFQGRFFFLFKKKILGFQNGEKIKQN